MADRRARRRRRARAARARAAGAALALPARASWARAAAPPPAAAARGAGLAGLLGDYEVDRGARRQHAAPISARCGRARPGACRSCSALDGVVQRRRRRTRPPAAPTCCRSRTCRCPACGCSPLLDAGPGAVGTRRPDRSAPLTPARRALLPDHPRHPAGRRRASPRAAAARPAVAQILRRCAVHAEQVLATAGLTVRRLDENAVREPVRDLDGPGRRGRTAGAATAPASRGATCGWPAPGRRSSRSAAPAPTSLDRVARLAAAAPTPVVGTALVLRRAGRARARAGSRSRRPGRHHDARAPQRPDTADGDDAGHPRARAAGPGLRPGAAAARRRAGRAAARDHAGRRGGGARERRCGRPDAEGGRPDRAQRAGDPGVSARPGPSSVPAPPSGVLLGTGRGGPGDAAAVPALRHPGRRRGPAGPGAAARRAGRGRRHAGPGRHRPAAAVAAAADPRRRRTSSAAEEARTGPRAARRWSSTTGRSRRAARSRSGPGSAASTSARSGRRPSSPSFAHADLASSAPSRVEFVPVVAPGLRAAGPRDRRCSPASTPASFGVLRRGRIESSRSTRPRPRGRCWPGRRRRRPACRADAGAGPRWAGCAARRRRP